MVKTCTIKVGGLKCGRKFPLRLYAKHLKDAHNIELLTNPIKVYTTIRDQVETTYDASNAALNKDGVLVDMVLRTYWGLSIYDASTKHIQMDLEYEDFIDYVVPIIESICRAGRDLREEDKINKAEIHKALAEGRTPPEELHPNWQYSEHVRVFRGSKFLALRDFFRSRKAKSSARR